uniref:CCHC-type domain-containing protein n=1 Tax=Buteo japonicus TaxID=224669 RepID=A0A8B9YZY9_9AVES
KKGNESCHRCGQLGHLRRACPQRMATQPRSMPELTKSSQSNFPGVCNKCNKFGHKASDCRSRFKKDGTPLTLYLGLQVAEASV